MTTPSTDPRAARPQVLFTGFEPFGGLAHNPSIAAARAAAAAWGEGGHCAVLPVDWKRTVPALRAAAASLASASAPARLVAFGLAAARSAVCVERTAFNEVEARADNSGHVATGALRVDGPRVRAAARATAELVTALGQRLPLPVTLSDDAGRYLCNAVLFEGLDPDGRFAGDALFVHIPPCDDAVAAAIGRAVVDVLRGDSSS